jgi:F-type H+-transporting ATPase subunit a
MEAHIPSLAPEVVFHLFGLSITNTMVNSFLALIIFLVLGLAIGNRAALRPKKLQNAIEFFLEILFGYFDQVTGSRKKTITFLPIVGSVFFFILLSNWLGLLPGTGTITSGHAPLLRPANTDLNLTLAMATVAVISSHVFGFISVGVFTHLNKFIQIGTLIKSIRKGPIAIFTALVEMIVGLIEIASEVSKIFSLSLRLFGNIFAGEVLISVIGSIAILMVPAPFMFLELLVGLIQAAVFSILTLVYMTVASSQPHGGDEEGAHH